MTLGTRAWGSLLLLIAAPLIGCGQGNGNSNGNDGGGNPGPDGGTAGGDAGDASPIVPPPPPPPPPIAVTACIPSGVGTDYQVGPGTGQLASLDLVPWESLGPGDTVRIFYRAAPYTGKFMIAAKGTEAAPVRVCGVRGPNGERPVIDGQGATTRATLLPSYGNKASDQAVHQARSLILVKHNGSGAYTEYPSHIQIDGLALRRAHPDYAFTDAAGASQRYAAFGACLWIERGHDITIADNDISDCSQGIFSRSNDEGDFAITKSIRVVANTLSGCGIVGDEHMHTSYMESAGIVYELNHYGAMRPGASGNSIKDRSVGTVVRFNRIDDGAHAIDLVEAEDFPATATADPKYRTTFVYGNQITKNGGLGSFIHYGGDHYGSAAGATWGEPIFRKGTLYFFSNTIYVTGTSAVIFQLSTTEEKAEVWNNVFVFADTVSEKSLRSKSDVASPWISGGIVNLDRNWASAGWQDSDQNHPVPGQLNGGANLLSGATAPIDLATFAPLRGSAIVDAAVAGPAAAAAFKVDFELDAKLTPVPRPMNGAASDLGAVEL